MTAAENNAYPWYSANKVVIWEAIRRLLALPDMQDHHFSYAFLSSYFQVIEALEGNNAWNYFLEHYGLVEERFQVGGSECTSWSFVFYNLLLALGYDWNHQTALDGKVRSSWYSHKDFSMLVWRLLKAKPYSDWSWSSFIEFPPLVKQNSWRVYTWNDVKYPVRSLKPSLVQAIDKGDLALLRLEIDLSRNKETTLKYVRRALLNHRMYEWLFQLRKDYVFPEDEGIPELEYFLWEKWNHDREAVNFEEENEEALAKWDEDNNLVRLFSFNEKLCNATLAQLECHDLLTPGILRAALSHLGKKFPIRIPNMKMISLAARLKNAVHSLPVEKQQGAMEAMERYFRKSYFQLVDVCYELGRDI